MNRNNIGPPLDNFEECCVNISLSETQVSPLSIDLNVFSGFSFLRSLNFQYMMDSMSGTWHLTLTCAGNTAEVHLPGFINQRVTVILMLRGPFSIQVGSSQILFIELKITIRNICTLLIDMVTLKMLKTENKKYVKIWALFHSAIYEYTKAV